VTWFLITGELPCLTRIKPAGHRHQWCDARNIQ